MSGDAASGRPQVQQEPEDESYYESGRVLGGTENE